MLTLPDQSKFASYTPVVTACFAMAYNEQHLSFPDISEHANQPSGYNFPKRSFGKTKVVHRAFQQSWFGKWKWLHYDSSKDLYVFAIPV